jgi:predicted RND superfamily exporter protein
MDREQALRLAYQTCARAMIQSWGVIGLGLAVFGLSDFTPTRHFGLLMIVLLSVGLAVNLVVLPSLLVGPLGGFLANRVNRPKVLYKTALNVDV